jgi:hypothetical protein
MEFILEYKNRYNQGAQPQNPLAQRKPLWNKIVG